MGRLWFLIPNTVLLVAASVLLVYFTLSCLDIKNTMYSKLGRLNDEYNERRLEREIRKYLRTINLKVSLVERIEIAVIDKSNIRYYIPFLNFYSLAASCLAIFVITFRPIYGMLLFLPSTVIICLLFSLAPILVLDLMGRYNSERVRRKLAEFVSVLNRWCAVKEDIFYAFEKSVESNIGMPLRTFIRDMVIQVERGIEPLDALDILQMKVNNTQFKDFVVNIKQSIRHRGDLRKLLANLENQFYKIEEEYNRRKISTYRDRLLIYCIMFAVLFIGYYFLKINPRVESFYLATIQGKSLLTLFTIFYAAGFYLSFRITKFDY